jgi:hypothetical protein
MFATQDEDITTRRFLTHMNNDPHIVSDMFRLCGYLWETVQHVIASCSKLDQSTITEMTRSPKNFHQELVKQLYRIEEPCSPNYKCELQVVLETTPTNSTGMYLSNGQDWSYNRPGITLTDIINKETGFFDAVTQLKRSQ